MRALPAGVKISLIIVNMLVMIVLVLAVVSVAIPGNINLDLPQESDWNIEFQGNLLLVEVPLRIYNGGSFDFTDFQVGLDIEDGQGGHLVEQVTPPQDIKAGGWTDAPIHFEIDISTIPNQTLEKIVFTNDTMGLQVSAGAGYLFSLVKGNVQLNQNITLGPMITDLYADVNSSHLVPDTGHVDLIIPFAFHNQDFLDGQDLQVSGALRNGTTVLGSALQTVRMPLSSPSGLTFHLTDQAALYLATHSGQLTADMTFNFHGAILRQTYHFYWVPPTP